MISREEARRLERSLLQEARTAVPSPLGDPVVVRRDRPLVGETAAQTKERIAREREIERSISRDPRRVAGRVLPFFYE